MDEIQVKKNTKPISLRVSFQTYARSPPGFPKGAEDAARTATPRAAHGPLNRGQVNRYE
ncbi:hypothetical protein [Streptomyces sp. NPDC048111]|uniref:hypothetical protein n=1 Tax=Streptomyces sp. NPDC048111 TaxID=3365500 RepID=UPI00371D15D4